MSTNLNTNNWPSSSELHLVRCARNRRPNVIINSHQFGNVANLMTFIMQLLAIVYERSTISRCCCQCSLFIFSSALAFPLFFSLTLNLLDFSVQDSVQMGAAASNKLCYTTHALITRIICNNRRQIKCKTCQATHRTKNNVLRFQVDKYLYKIHMS